MSNYNNLISGSVDFRSTMAFYVKDNKIINPFAKERHSAYEVKIEPLRFTLSQARKIKNKLYYSFLLRRDPNISKLYKTIEQSLSKIKVDDKTKTFMDLRAPLLKAIHSGSEEEIEKYKPCQELLEALTKLLHLCFIKIPAAPKMLANNPDLEEEPETLSSKAKIQLLNIFRKTQGI